MFDSDTTVPAEIRNNAIIVDSNLLLLVLIGLFDKRSIPSFSERLSGYSIEDYEYLLSLLQDKVIVITPNIITEISNLSGKFQRRKEFFQFLGNYIQSLNELYVQSSSVVIKDTFVKFGITDATIIELAKQGITTLTVDFNLFYYLSNQNYSAINFNQLRSQYILKKQKK
jgi:hypothetical protein